LHHGLVAFEFLSEMLDLDLETLIVRAGLLNRFHIPSLVDDLGLHRVGVFPQRG
jgi:hypothetical protein